MAFMIPQTEHLTMYHVETHEAGTEQIPQDVCGDLGELLDLGLDDVTASSEALVARLRPYLEGHAIEVYTGWYSRLSAPGYLDCTSWDGPYATEKQARAACRDEYECDDNGNYPEGV